MLPTNFDPQMNSSWATTRNRQHFSKLCFESRFNTIKLRFYRLPQILDLMNTNAVIITTSGTTGVPKICCQTHATILSEISGCLSAGDGVVRLNVMRPGSTSLPSVIFESLFYRSPRIITAQPVTADLVLSVLQKYDVNVVGMLPHNIYAMYKRMLTGNFNLTKLTTIQSGAASLSADTINNLCKMVPNVEFRFIYGMTEVGLIACSNAKTKPGSVGYLLTDLSVKV